jgi:hypothetical protein
MIKVNDKVLEVGDTVVFRNGGKSIVENVSYYSEDLFLIDIKGYQANWFNNGRFFVENDTDLDIVDIIKAPKPEEIFIELTYNYGLDENIAICYDSFEYLTECKDECNEDIAVLKVVMKDKKLISVEVVQNDKR